MYLINRECRGSASTLPGVAPKGVPPMRRQSIPFTRTLRCAKCHRDLPREAFDPNPTSRDRFHPLYRRCRDCRVPMPPVDPRPRPPIPNPDDPETMLVPLTHGKFALIDANDAELVSAFKWTAVLCFGTWYSRRSIRNAKTGKASVQSLHHFILDLPARSMVDHENRNGLDCRRLNLRPCTYAQNNSNRALQRNNTTGYRGVCATRTPGRWQAAIRVSRKSIRLGRFDSPEEAARAYDDAARRYFGRFASLNFPRDGEQGVRP